MAETLYTVLDAEGRASHGRHVQWALPVNGQPGAGAWMPRIDPLEPCRSGYHLCRLAQLRDWLGPRIWVAEGRGACIETALQLVYAEARLLYATAWGDRSAAAFARDCAAHILPIYNAARAAGISAPTWDGILVTERAWQIQHLARYLDGTAEPLP